MPRGASPLSLGDVVVSDYRVPPFYKDETLIVNEVNNVGTPGNPHWRAAAPAQRAGLARREQRRSPVIFTIARTYARDPGCCSPPIS